MILFQRGGVMDLKMQRKSIAEISLSIERWNKIVKLFLTYLLGIMQVIDNKG